MTRRPRASSTRLAAFLMGGALVGKLLGFVRELEMARVLGVSFVADSFRGAMTAVLLPIAPMQNDMVPSTLIPLHRKWQQEGVATERFTALMAIFGLVTLAITTIVWLLANEWVDIIVGGFGPAAHDTTVSFVRVMALAMPASTLSACMSSIEISVGRSRITTIRAAVQNVGIIGGIAVMAVTGEPIAMAWGFTLAFNVIAAYGGYRLWREGEIDPSRINLGDAKQALHEFYVRIRPILFQPVAEQGYTLLERMIGSSIGVGVIAALDYARTVTDTAMYVVSQPIGYVVLVQPIHERAAIREKVSSLARPLLTLMLPASIILGILSADIVTVLFQRGAFQTDAVELTGAALRGMSFGLWANTLGLILIRMINARNRNDQAAKVIIASFCAHAAVNLLLWHYSSLAIMGIGLSESTRGIVMLLGAALALGSMRQVIVESMRSLPLCVAVSVLTVGIVHAAAEPLTRVALAGLLFVVIETIMFFPQIRAFAQQRSRRGKPTVEGYS